MVILGSQKKRVSTKATKTASVSTVSSAPTETPQSSGTLEQLISTLEADETDEPKNAPLIELQSRNTGIGARRSLDKMIREAEARKAAAQSATKSGTLSENEDETEIANLPDLKGSSTIHKKMKKRPSYRQSTSRSSLTDDETLAMLGSMRVATPPLQCRLCFLFFIFNFYSPWKV